MLLSISPPRSSMLSTQSEAYQARTRSKSIGKPEPLATHRIISHRPKSTTNISTYEIQQKGRTALWAKTTKPVIGSSILQITTPKVDGEAIVATAKLRSDGCKVLLGDPASKTRAAEWTQISHSCNGADVVIVAQFVHNGKMYFWRRAQEDCSSSGEEEEEEDDNDLADLELVTPEASETVLAAYIPHSHSRDAEDQIGKLDYMLDLGPKLELLCLTAVLGARQSAQMQRRTRYSGPRFLVDLQQSILSAKGA